MFCSRTCSGQVDVFISEEKLVRMRIDKEFESFDQAELKAPPALTEYRQRNYLKFSHVSP